jgi:hypothetical protein
MGGMNLSRRGFIAGLLAAPIIVRPGILMPVKPLPIEGRLGTFTGISFTQSELSLTIEQFSQRYIQPAMRELERQLKVDAEKMVAEMWRTPTHGGLDLILGWKAA